jgi:hypothetical protein
MSSENSSSPQEIVQGLYDEMGTWWKVAEFLDEYHDENIYAALVWKVARKGTRIFRINEALISAGLIEAPPVMVEVEACKDCGQVHTLHLTCPPRRSRDTRRTRAWHGSPEQAEELDRRLKDLGFRNVQHFIDYAVLTGKWFSPEEKEELKERGYHFG